MKIEVLIKEPYQYSYEAEIDYTLDEFHRIVGGYIETVQCPGVPGVKLICNDEGKLMGLTPNLFIGKSDVIVGTVIAVGVDGEEFVSLTEKQRYDAGLSLAVRAIHDPETIRRATGYADGI